jgi:hypothetical protein
MRKEYSYGAVDDGQDGDRRLQFIRGFGNLLSHFDIAFIFESM